MTKEELKGVLFVCFCARFVFTTEIRKSLDHSGYTCELEKETLTMTLTKPGLV